MSIFDKLFGIKHRPISVAAGVNVATPLIKVARKWLAMEPAVEKGNEHRVRWHISLYGKHPLTLNYRRLERNKYAPWGRGDLSGLPQ